MEIAEDLKLVETTEILVFKYKHSPDLFELIYYKDRDKCMVMKNGKPAELNKLNGSETMKYKEVLEIAINYHHDRDGEYLN